MEQWTVKLVGQVANPFEAEVVVDAPNAEEARKFALELVKEQDECVVVTELGETVLNNVKATEVIRHARRAVR